MTDTQNSQVKCEICGESSSYEIVTHIREAHGKSAEEYKSEHSGADLIHGDLLKRLEAIEIHVDSDGTPWRVVATDELFGMRGFGPPIPSPTAPPLDPHYRFPRDEIRNLYVAFEAGLRPLLVGPKGCGKTEMVKQMCAVTGWGMRRVGFNGEVTSSTLLGSPRANPGGGTYFMYGVVPLAMKNQECLLLDEVSFCEPDMAAALHPVMERNSSLTLLENDGEIILPGARFRIVGTDNVGAQGDVSGMYHGTKPINAAFLDRWDLQINVGYLRPEEEVLVLFNKVKGLPKVTAERMVELAGETRYKQGNEDIMDSISLRQLLAWGDMTSRLRDLKTAWEVTVISKASEEDAVALRELYSHKFGEE